MILSAKKGIQDIVLTLAALGLKEVVICPGSRNAPLTISFNRHPDFHCTSIRDERSGGFFALGKARSLNQPVAVVCTSGTASLNFAPAVAEAFYQRIPLIVITADRPKQWTDQGDGQVINQTNIYGNFIRKSYELKGDQTTEEDLWVIERSICEGWGIATITDRGPVHFNVPLHEPLYEVTEEGFATPRITHTIQLERKLITRDLMALADEFAKHKKVMVLIGQYPTLTGFEKLLGQLAEYENVAILTESTGNIHNPYFIENIDRCITHLSDEEAAEMMPDLLITMGGAVVSKRIKKMLRNHKPEAHWNVDPFDAARDTYQSLTRAIPMYAADFLLAFVYRIEAPESDYKRKWEDLHHKMTRLHEQYLTQCPYSDLKVFEKIFASLPKDINLLLANSSPIRYAQLFDSKIVAETFSNRGTSGIDGCTSTAAGTASVAPEKEFLLITGDVAFHYDANGLWNQEQLNNLKIIVINNGGGGIFRIIQGPGQVEELEPFFETKMTASVERQAERFHWKYLTAVDEDSLTSALKEFFAILGQRVILEIFTPAEENPKVLKSYWEFLKSGAAMG